MLLIIAYEYYHHDAWGLQYGYALAAIGHLIGAIIKAKKAATPSISEPVAAS